MIIENWENPIINFMYTLVSEVKFYWKAVCLIATIHNICFQCHLVTTCSNAQ